MPEQKTFTQQVLSKDTLLPISFVVVIMSGMVWLTSMFSAIQANSTSIAGIQARLSTIELSNIDIVDRMARIETKLDLLLEK